MSNDVLVARGVCVRFAGVPAPVLQELDLHVTAGESVAVMGPSGSGKSTLLSVLGALRAANSGSISLLGASPTSAADGDRLRARHVGFVFQRAHLLPFLSVMENVALGLHLAGHGAVAPGVVEETLDAVGLGTLRSRRASQLSVGEAQRTAVARALVKAPDLLLADEPTGALDSENATRVMDALLVRSRGGARPALVVATHDPAVAGRCDRVLYLHGGRLR